MFWFIASADWHLDETKPACRLEGEDWLATQARKLLWIEHFSELHGNCPIVVAGDICHYWRLSPGFLSFLIEHMPPDVYCIPGQHDLPYHSMGSYSQSALHLLEVAGALKVIHKPTRIEKGGAVVHPLSLGEAPGRMHRPVNEEDFNVLIGHVLMWKDKCPPWAMFNNSAVKIWPEVSKEFGLVLTGDNHEQWWMVEPSRCKQTWINPGPILRGNATECDLAPSVFVVAYDHKGIHTVTRHKIPLQDSVRVASDLLNDVQGMYRQELDEYDIRRGTTFKELLKRYITSDKVSPRVKAVLEQAEKEWKDELDHT